MTEFNHIQNVSLMPTPQYVVSLKSIHKLTEGYQGPIALMEMIIRCRNCKYRMESGWCRLLRNDVSDNDFCCWAKMKELEW